MNYNKLDYRYNLKKTIMSPIVRDKLGGIVKIAHACQMHGPFFSGVLKQKNHLNQDQLYALCHYLGLKNEEVDFLSLCLAYMRSANTQRKKELKNKIVLIQKSRLKTDHYIEAETVNTSESVFLEYYSDPYFKLIHTFLQVSYYSRNSNQIAVDLNLHIDKLSHYLNRLVDFGFIEIQSSQIKVLKQNYHLPKDAYICQSHQLSLKNLSLNQSQKLAKEDFESICVSFSANQDVYNKIYEAFLEFLKLSQGYVKETSKITGVYQLNFDLFRWSK